MVAHARASLCVPPWCRRLSEVAGAHQHAADNVLALLSTGRRDGSKVLQCDAAWCRCTPFHSATVRTQNVSDLLIVVQ